MFKRSVITDEISQDFDVAIELAKKYSLDGIEIRSIWGKGPHELEREEITEIKTRISEEGLGVSAISAPFYKCHLDREDEIKEQIIVLEKCIKLAQHVGTTIIRGFTFWAKDSFDDNLDKIVSRFEKPVELLKREGMTLALEFDPSVYASNARKLVKVIEGIHSPYVKGLWDPGNDIYDPEGEKPYPDGYNIIKPHIVHVHLKDAVRLPDGRPISVPIGEGDVDYKGQLKALIEDGYNGYVALETHYRQKHEIDDSLLALPQGYAFSYMGYEATEECLMKWNKIMESI